MKKLTLSAGLIGALALSRPALAETYYGPEISSLARQTIDVMRMHQYVVQQQLALDDTPTFLELMVRSMPATLEFDDGGRSSVAITRAGTSMGFGFGKPTTDLAAFAGFQGDWIMTTEPLNPFRSKQGLELGQATVYAGLAAHGFQITYGAIFETGERGLNANGYFTRTEHRYREGTPANIAPKSVYEERSTPTFFTFTQAEGVSLGGTLAKLGEAQQLQLAALRAELAPVKLIDKFGLRESFGVPGIGFDRYAAEIDYWGDRFAETRRAAEALAKSPGGALAAPVNELERQWQETWEVPVFLDDIAGTGLRARVVPQVKPQVKLRAVEAAYRYQSEKLNAGLRAFVFDRGGRFTGSAEVYLAIRPDVFEHLSVLGVPWMTFSYSYNVPESATFLPIPNAHVFGIQWIYGPPAMGRPLVPLVAEHQGSDEDAGDPGARKGGEYR